MKIRTGFVSNSSSTSFLIISKEALNKADFLELMGVARTSPLAGMFTELFDAVLQNSDMVDFKSTDKHTSFEALFPGSRGHIPERMMQKLKEARNRGLKAYYGQLSSDGSYIESFFCTDSFEVQNEKIYFNGLECVW